jgi:HrpA-like RNA helicase
MTELVPVLERLQKNISPPPEMQASRETTKPLSPEKIISEKKMPPLEGLRVYKEKDTIIKAIQENPVIILKAGTGTGKTRAGTQLALEAIGETGKMIVTENLRKATESSCETVSIDRNEPVGETIGYRNKYGHKESEKTRMLFCPIRSLLNTMSKDPLLKETNLIFMDEVHKESKELELCMIELGELQLKRKAAGLPELKLIFTSATVDDEKLRRHFPKQKQSKYRENNHLK